MTDNTPLNADDELLQILEPHYWNQGESDGKEAARHSLTFKQLSRLLKKHELQARLFQLDALIGINDKTFNRWSQRDIANFFNTVGKQYRALKQELEKL